MAEAILVPQVGQDLTEAKVVALHVKVGDKVKKGDVVAEVESEKASFEVEAFSSGTVTHIAYKLGDLATVLQPLLFVGEAGEKVGQPQAMRELRLPQLSAHLRRRQSKSILARPTSPVFALGEAARLHERDRYFERDRKRAARSGCLEGHRTALEVIGDIRIGRKVRLAIRSLRDGTGIPVVFIHGFGAELAAWRPFVEHSASPIRRPGSTSRPMAPHRMRYGRF